MSYQQVQLLARKLRRNQTDAEAFFWTKVRGRSFHDLRFHRQYIYQYDYFNNEKRFFIFDFYNHKNRLCIELDGPIHKYQHDYDQNRQHIIESHNIKVLRFTNEEVLTQWTTVSEKILHCIET